MAKTQLKFPVLNDVEYFDVYQNKQNTITFNGLEINGLTWRKLQELIGKKIGAGVYKYSFKQNKDSNIFNGTIRAISNREKKLNDSNNPEITNQLLSLQKEIQSIKNNSGNVGTDLLISVTKQSYETQINFMTLQLNQKDKVIEKLEKNIDDLEKELTEQDSIIDDLKGKTGISQYIGIVQDLLKVKNGKVEKISLKDSDSSDIPKEFIDLLGVVDWSQVEDNIKQEIFKYLNMFIPKLPLKNRG